VTLYEEALQAVPEGPQRAGLLSNLGNASRERYTVTRAIGDLERAMSLYEEALRLVPEGPQRGALLSNLGNASRERYTVTGAIEDIERALNLYEEALRLVPEGPQRGALLVNLGTAYANRFIGDRASNLESAIDSFTAAAKIFKAAPGEDNEYAARIDELIDTLR
jgi:tetratricopeptide (TPR) repeat protein